MSQHVIALDQGTTSSRTIVFDKKGNIVSKAKATLIVTNYFIIN